MTKYPLLLTILSARLFFFFATATSYDDDVRPIPWKEVNLVVNIVDSTLILNNEDTLDFDNATFELYKTTDSMLTGYWLIQAYAIASGEMDTIPLTEFLDNDSIPFPLDTMPTSFRFEAWTDDFAMFFEHEF